MLNERRAAYKQLFLTLRRAKMKISTSFRVLVLISTALVIGRCSLAGSFSRKLKR